MIREESRDTIETKLNSVDEKTAKNMLNGYFENTNSRQKGSKAPTKLAYNVWHLVVIMRSEDVIKLFIDKGVYIHGENQYKYNIVHSMILAAAFEPELEDDLMIKYRFIMSKISKSDKHKLLMTENDDGMRPLEFAMHNSATGLFQGRKQLSISILLTIYF